MVTSMPGPIFRRLCLVALLCLGGSIARTSEPDNDWLDAVNSLFHGRPTIGVWYGFTSLSHVSVISELPDPGMIELRFGSTKLDRFLDGMDIVGYRHGYLGIANISNDLGGSDKGSGGNPAVRTSTWRFGAYTTKGYGYSLAEGMVPDGILLSHTTGHSLSSFRATDSITIPSDRDLLESYEGALRLGTMMQAGVGLHLAPFLAVEGGYERSLLFRRLVFWEWAGSAVLEGAGHWAIDRFVERVRKTAPAAVPVLHFLLRNGWSFAASQLRRSEMNFPFHSEPALVGDTFTLGVTFIF